MEVSSSFLKEQLECIFTDIYPDSVKIGMIASKELIKTVKDALIKYKAKNIVLDPVMVATSGAKLISDDAIDTLKKELLPIAAVVTPNIPEAEVRISEENHCAVLLKGGHNLNDANDLLADGKNITWFQGKRIDNPNTHGTGCTLSSAIAANLAKGFSLVDSVKKAKEYISGALNAMLDLGKGSGPMNHGFMIK